TTEAMAVWMRTAPRADERFEIGLIPSSSRLFRRLLRIDRLCLWICGFWRSIHRSATLNVVSDVASRRWKESSRPRRQRRHFVRIQRLHEPRRDQYHQLRALGVLGFTLEEVPEDRQAAEQRNRGAVLLCQVVEQAGDD